MSFSEGGEDDFGEGTINPEYYAPAENNAFKYQQLSAFSIFVKVNI
ncbi:MAG: hypothetical protein JW864_08785 [Spirochaetes bacterium]|nr:hypothetical protein [Spirochaetota bacterium]